MGSASAEIVDRFDDPILPDLLGRALSTLIEFEYCVALSTAARATRSTFTTRSQPTGPGGSDQLRQDTYVLNPLYNAYQRGLKTGVYRLRELVSEGLVDRGRFENTGICDTASEEIGYLTHGWPAGCEELCIANGIARRRVRGTSRCHAQRPKAVSRTKTSQVCRRSFRSLQPRSALLAPCPIDASVEIRRIRGPTPRGPSAEIFSVLESGSLLIYCCGPLDRFGWSETRDLDYDG